MTMYLAPAKLNLTLRVVGQRADGYHLLQSVFRLVDLCDEIAIETRQDGKIHFESTLFSGTDNLAYRAAALLKPYTKASCGANIRVIKHIPVGAGLGGGSSDAATVLMVLNQQWALHWDRPTLMQLGAKLGADVPFFIYGKDAFVEGIGDKMTAVHVAPEWYVILYPEIVVPTAKIFQHPNLTRNSKPCIIRNLDKYSDRINDLQPVAIRLYPQIADALVLLKQYSDLAMMTGSGSCIFAPFSTKQEALSVYQDVRQHYPAYCVVSLTEHPCYRKITVDK